MRLIQYQQLVGPVDTPPPPSQDGGLAIKRISRLFQYQSEFAPVLVPDPTVDTSAQGVFQARTFARRGLRASQQQSFAMDTQWTAPTPPTVPELVVVQSPMPRGRRVSRAPWQPVEPHFGVPVDVPVMSWTGYFPTNLPHWKRKAHPSRMQFLAWDEVLFPDVVFPPDMTVAVFPDRVHRAPRIAQHPEPSWPPFTADVSVTAPPLSWRPTYPNRLFRKPGLTAARQQFLALYPQEIPVIAVSHLSGGRGYYVVPGRPRRFVVPPHKRKFTVN